MLFRGQYVGQKVKIGEENSWVYDDRRLHHLQHHIRLPDRR